MVRYLFISYCSVLFVSVIACSNLRAQTKSISIRPEIESIVASLQKEKLIHLGYPVGHAGIPETKNKYHKLYLQLKRKASIEELVQLTANSSPSITIYAFDILASKNYIHLKDIFLGHASDTTHIYIAGGCTGIIDHVNWFMFSQVKPDPKSNSTNRLSLNEYHFYCTRFNKEDSTFVCN